MALTFADTHNMIKYLTKSDASEGFDQIIDFFITSSIQYTLTVNPNIYVSCIKQFWSSVSIKKTNDMVRLQALIDRKKQAANDVVAADVLADDIIADVAVEPTPPSPTPITTPPPPQQEVTYTLPLSPHQSPQKQPSSPPQPSQTTTISMDLLNNLLETCTALTKRVGHLEQDKIAQALEITKLKQRVKRLEKKNKLEVSGLNRLRKGIIELIDADEDVILEEVDAKKDLFREEPAELKEVIEVVTTAKLMTEVVTATATTILATPIDAASITAAPSTAKRRK
nr:hypothetical protein [Tanacetum cinerariifolium]